MARVTKINVGGTNYDIAHEGELKNSGFEVVTELPTTGLFAGREVMYNGKKYVYSSGWKEEITADTMYEDKLLYNIGNIVPDGSVIDRVMTESGRANVYAFTKPDAISVQYSQDAGATWADYELSDLDKQNLCTFSKSIYCGGPDVTAGNVNYRLRVNLFPKLNHVWIFHKLILSFTYGSANNRWLTIRCLRKNQEDIDTNYVTIIDKGYIYSSVGNIAVNLGDINMLNDYDKVVLDMGYDVVDTGKGLSLTSLSMYASYSQPTNTLAKYGNMFYYDINKKSYFAGAVESKELINFDVNNIEPTQTGSNVSKTSTWLWQYLVQAVNWLKANNVRLSAYNTKVAALEQADNTKLDKRAYNQIYTNCGYVNFDNNSVTGALIIELPFAPNSDENNSMTFIELNVYSHKQGCSKYIIGVYSYSQNSYYNWSVYSYMGYNYFSKISFGRRTDNNNIVVVLGDFTDLHNYEHFSINNIITGFNRNNDDTDGFLLYTDSDSNNYGILKQSTYKPLIISYDDLTNKPTLATVATSGSYNDLIDKPTFSGSYNDLTDKPTLFSGSYNDLTDKPTLFSGSYEDLTDKPNLATVATSGSYNDLIDKPTFSGSYNDLTDKPTLFSGSYDDLTNKPNLATVATSGNYDDLLNKPALVFSNIGGTISSVQIPDGLIANAKLANPSMSLNGITVNLGDTAILPWKVEIDGTTYSARLWNNWLWIYNGGWIKKFYLLSQEPIQPIQPTNVVQITSFANLDWYNEQVSEYEIDSNTTFELLNGKVFIASQLIDCSANQLTLNLYPIIAKDYVKGSLDNVISDLKDNNFAVFVENDLDTILTSGSDFCVRIKISKVPTYKAIIECYVAR